MTLYYYDNRMDPITIVVITCLSSGIAFMCGSWLSPRTKALKEEISYWRGVAGNFKKEAGSLEKKITKMNPDDLESLIPEKYGFLKPVINQVLENPEMLQQVISKFMPQLAKGTEGSTPAIDSKNVWN